MQFERPHGADFTFHEDSARSLSDRVFQDQLGKPHTRMFQWTAMSSDLSHMEYLWDLLSRCVQQRPVSKATWDSAGTFAFAVYEGFKCKQDTVAAAVYPEDAHKSVNLEYLLWRLL